MTEAAHDPHTDPDVPASDVTTDQVGLDTTDEEEDTEDEEDEDS
jgi:hypothetical protein